VENAAANCGFAGFDAVCKKKALEIGLRIVELVSRDTALGTDLVIVRIDNMLADVESSIL
jgi:hypothetical protein